jgi:ATP-binding protein involved in chromosome partitioning
MRIVGVIENMTSEVFGVGGGERLATELGVPLLGSVPLDPALREACDEGRPYVTTEIAAIAETIDASRAGGFTRTLPLVS